MRNWKLYILFATTFLLQSCLQQEEDIFGKSVSERLNDAQKLYGSILEDAPNGWVLEYVAGDNNETRRGGFNYLLKFAGGKVTASVDALALSDINPSIDPYTEITSQYRLDQDMSVTLSFDTYNSFLHYYHEQHGSYTTYKGDFEFTIMEAYDNLIVLRGKKYGSIMEMHRLPEDAKWEDYLKDVNSIVGNISIYSIYNLMRNGSKVGDVSLNSNNRYTFTATDGKKSSSNAIYTRTGMKLLDPWEIDGIKIQHFNWDDAKKILTCSDPGADFTLVPLLDSSYVYYEQYLGTYLLSYVDESENFVERTVTLERKIEKQSFLVKGMTDFDLEFIYDKKTGQLRLMPQDIGKSSDNYTVSLFPWAPDVGLINLSTLVGMVSIINLQELANNKIQFIFMDNGVWKEHEVFGFLLYKSDSVLGSHRELNLKGLYTDGENRFFYLTLTKQ